MTPTPTPASTPALAMPTAADFHPGPVLAYGQVYLRANVSQMLRGDGKYSYIFPVAEREKIGELWCTNNFRLLWGGDEGTEFVQANETALKPGAAINVTFSRLRPHTDLTGTELQGHIRSAAMAPPRWAASHRPRPPVEAITCSADARQ